MMDLVSGLQYKDAYGTGGKHGPICAAEGSHYSLTVQCLRPSLLWFGHYSSGSQFKRLKSALRHGVAESPSWLGLSCAMVDDG